MNRGEPVFVRSDPLQRVCLARLARRPAEAGHYEQRPVPLGKWHLRKCWGGCATTFCGRATRLVSVCYEREKRFWMWGRPEPITVLASCLLSSLPFTNH